MKKRMILMLVAVTALVGVLGAVKLQQVRAAMAEYASFQPPPEAVTTTVVRQEKWPATFKAVGSVAAVRGVTVAADLPGVVESINFDSGHAVREGEVLAQLDTRTELAQLRAAEAQRDLAKMNLDRARGLKEERIVAQAEFDRAEAEFKQAEASVGEIRATIARKTIRAPFSGILGIRQANLGQYLAAGTPIVSLQALDPIYVNFALPQQHVGRVPPGTSIGISMESADTGLRGRVNAIDSIIDEETRNVQIQAVLRNPGGRLRPGMFVEAHVPIGKAETVIGLPASAIARAPYGDSVFVVSTLKGQDGKSYKGVTQRFVKVGAARGDLVAVLSGLEPGEEVVTSGVFKLRNQAAVQVNNSVQPSNNAAPNPEES
jgi:membrane fusion protein (multidrug efflux system)